MRHRRFIGSAIAAAAATLTCGMTATTAMAATGNKAAPAVTPSVTTVSWHKITLQNGWKSAATSSYTVAAPSYSASNGVVYLDGSLHQPAGSNTQFGVLPTGYRPAHTLYLTVLTGGGSGTPGTVKITTAGVMTASSPTHAGASQYLTSLAAVSFPATGAHWTNLSLKNGWKSGATAFHTGSPAYTVKSGIVYLAGSMSNPATQKQVTTLPLSLRPLSNLYITVYNESGYAGTVHIDKNGVFYAYGPTAFGQTSLDGLSYPTAAAHLTWHKFALDSGWSSSQGAYSTGNPAYAVSGPIVYLAGSMNYTGAGVSTGFAALPTAIATPHIIARQVYTNGTTTGEFLSIPKDGENFADSSPASNSQLFTSLAGIAYPHNS